MRRRVREAGPGAVHPRRPAAAGDGRTSSGSSRTTSRRPTAAEIEQLLVEPSWTARWRRCSPSSTGSRWRRRRSARRTAARLRTGEAVVVKVQRPGIADADRTRPRRAAAGRRDVEAAGQWAAEYHVERAHRGVRRPAARGARLPHRGPQRDRDRGSGSPRDGARPRPGRVHDELDAPRVLVMEWLDGVSVREVGAIDAMGIDRERAGRRAAAVPPCSRCSSTATSTPTRIPATCWSRRRGRSASSTSARPAGSTRMEESSIRDDDVRGQPAGRRRCCARRCSRSRRCGAASTTSSSSGRSARFMSRNLGPGSVPSAAMFNELLQLFFSFGLTLPPEFSTFFRAMITLEGTLTILQPGLPRDRGVAGVAAEWTQEQFTPASHGGDGEGRARRRWRRCCDASRATSTGWRRSSSGATCGPASASSPPRTTCGS